MRIGSSGVLIGAACALVLTGCAESKPLDYPGSTFLPSTSAGPNAGGTPGTAAPTGGGTPAPATAPTGGGAGSTGGATSAPNTAPSPGPATAVVTVIAVDATKQPRDGFTLASSDPVGTLSCEDAVPSRSATTAGIYHCGPSAASADVCWPTQDNVTLLCASDPWERTLRKYTVDPPLTPIGRTDSPEPWALELADGRQCRIRVGGAWGGRSDGLVGAYSCSGGHDVVLQPSDARTAIDTSSDTWRVAVGPLGSGNPDFPPPPKIEVRTAYFAATSSS
ncbi:hypothetical protein [Nocardia sp. AG03]|uniref:hypothetical protein n=1 Tax=Nocardia sp. AG03 TaxID=3025312 RepID=UPI002418872C|nr:hypothetical protein [Nocardia sp. AG03]